MLTSRDGLKLVTGLCELGFEIFILEQALVEGIVLYLKSRVHNMFAK